MKFSSKIVFSCTLTIAIVFSLGSTIMIFKNHEHLLHLLITQNTNTHLLESYTLESKLIQDSLNSITNHGSDSAKMDELASYYVQQFSSIENQKNHSYHLSTIHTTLLSNIATPLLKQIDTTNTNQYLITNLNGNYYMLLSSKISAGNNTYYLTSSYDITSCYQERNRQYRSFLFIDGGILLFSFIILRYLSQFLTKPILRLKEVSKRITLGNYHERTNITSQDEIGELSKNFDEMANAIEDRIAELKLNAKQKEEFMGSFSHEVKTPMTAILGFAEMLCTMDVDKATLKKAATYIYTEGKRLESLSYTLLDLLSIGKEDIQLTSVSTTHIKKQLEQYYQGLSLTCKLVFTMADAKVLSNSDLLFTLLRNLIDNAIKASKNDQEIIITGTLKNTHYLFSIEDHGIGMCKKDIQHAMQPFYMADKSRSRAKGGAGLGLSIVQKILDLHQTTLQIESTINQGTTVQFTLEVANHEAL